jgi:dihydroorotase
MARYHGPCDRHAQPRATGHHVRLAAEYRQRILRAMRDAPRQFEPLMTLYLTDSTGEADIREAAETSWLHAVKLYPAGATTNSDAGVGSLAALYPVLGSWRRSTCPCWYTARSRIRASTSSIARRPSSNAAGAHRRAFPAAARGAGTHHHARRGGFRARRGSAVAATITAHHLLLNRNDMLVGGIRPHYYCLPILKRREHQEALRAAAVSGDPGILPRHRLRAPRIGQ